MYCVVPGEAAIYKSLADYYLCAANMNQASAPP